MYGVLFAIALGFGVVGDLAGCASVRLPALWIPLLTACHYVAILLAAVRFGLAIGLGAALLVSVAHITASMTVCGEPLSQQGEMAAFILVGLSAGFLIKKKEVNTGNVGVQARINDGGEQTGGEALSPETGEVVKIPVGFIRAVRAPVSAIESAGYVLEDSALTDANHREVAAIILKECHRLDVLIRLLEFGHARPPEYREVDLSAVLDDIVRCGEALTSPARITLRKEERPGLMRVVCDAELLEQAVLNLLGNAIRVAHGGEIVLSAHVDRRNVVIEISDPRLGVLGQLGITTATVPEGALLHPPGADVPRGPQGGTQ